MTSIIINISGGKIQNKSVVSTAFGILSDGHYRVLIEEITGRSIPQNKYYWKVVVPAVKDGLRHLGWDEIKTDEDAHEFIKDEFLKREIRNNDTGDSKTIPGSTANLSTKEFNEFIEAVIKWSAEFLGVQIPFPNEPMIAHYDKDIKATIIQ